MGACSSKPQQDFQLTLEQRLYRTIPGHHAHQQIVHESSRFSTLYSSQISNNNFQFLLSIQPYDDLKSESTIRVELQIMNDTLSVLINKGYEWVLLEDLVRDNAQNGWLIVRALEKRSNEHYTLKVVNFQDFDDLRFQQAIYEIAMMRRLQSGEPHINIIRLKDAYIVQCNQQKHAYRCLIMVMEYFDSTLHEIIDFRKANSWRWLPQELCALFRDLSGAIQRMHSLDIAHRDIRPVNIWYNCVDKCYKIGGFSEAKIVDCRYQAITKDNKYQEVFDEFTLNTVRGVPQFLPPEILKAYHENPSQNVLKFSPFKQDCYAFGLVFTLMGQLNPDLDLNVLQSQLKKDGRPYLDIDTDNWTLNGMIKDLTDKSPNDRARIIDIYRKAEQEFDVTEYPRPNENNLVSSLKFQTKQQQDELYINDQESLAHTYYHMFDYDQWIFQFEQILEFHQNQNNDPQIANTLEKIGNGYLEINDLSRAQDYLIRASTVLNDMGNKARSIGSTGQIDVSIIYFERAIECMRKSANGDETTELALLLQNLGNSFSMKGDFIKARAMQQEALAIIKNTKGQHSLEGARILNNLGNAYAKLGNYKKADKRLKNALKIVENVYMDEITQISMKAMCLTNLGQVQRLKGNLEKAKNSLEEALALRQQAFGSGHIDVAGNVENLGNVYYDMGQYHFARQYYERALVIKKSKMQEDNPELAITLNNIGNICKQSGELQKSQLCYEDALQILKGKYGNQDHPSIAGTLGNLGLVFKEMQKYSESAQYLRLAVEMLSQCVGQDHPQYEFFMNHLKQTAILSNK